MRSISSRRSTTTRGVRRSLSVVSCAVLALSVLLVPAGVASAESPAPTANAVARIENDIARVLRSSPGATRTGPFEVSWDGGAVVSTWTPPSRPRDAGSTQGTLALGQQALASSSYAGCPDGTTVHWFCFYENASFGGRMLQFRDCPSTQSLASYGFANQTTSWVNNRSGATITVYDGSTNGTVLWREYGRSHSSNVGSWANDRADTFTCRT
jgi:hypothetical protein